MPFLPDAVVDKVKGPAYKQSVDEKQCNGKSLARETTISVSPVCTQRGGTPEDFASLQTEQKNSKSANIDAVSTLELCRESHEAQHDITMLIISRNHE